MDNLVGVANILNQPCFPMSITLDNIIVELESFENNKVFDCGSCSYMNDCDDVCYYIKNTALIPSPKTKLRAVAIITHIINASDSDFDMDYSNWIMIDSQGFQFKGTWICDKFLSRRLQNSYSLLQSTQARQLVLFPELEEGIEPAVFILKAGMREFRFEVGDYSEDVKNILKPIKPTDDLTEKVKAYIKSDSYCSFIKSLKANQLDLSQENIDFIVANLASNYYRYVDNSKNVWDNEKELFKYYPYIVSLAEICTFDFAEKTIITIPNKALERCKIIISKYSIEHQIYQICISGENITAITFSQTYSSREEMYILKNSISRLIWYDMELSRITFGMCTLTKTIDGSKCPEQIFLCGERELDLFNYNKNANAGYRDDLHEAYRSSWEANVARVLRLTHHQYKYESQHYEMNKYTYLPDFVLGDGTILEVKGIWDRESLGKVAELHKEFPELKIITLDSELYYDINRKYKNISNWEQTPVSIHSNILSVVGLSYVPDQTIFDDLSVGSKVLFVRESNNKYDNYAILVTSLDGRAIGHVSAEWAVVYAPKLDIGVKYEITIKEITSKVIKVEAIRANIEQEILYDCFIPVNVYDDTKEQLAFPFFYT